MNKPCSKCKLIKAASHFSPQRESSDGLSSWCLECKSNLEHQKRRIVGIVRRPAPGVVNSDEKECLGCHRVYPLDEFPQNSRGRMGRGSYCRSCNREYHNQEKFRKQHRDATRRYRQKHRERWRFLHRCNMLKRRAILVQADTGRVTKEFLTELYNTEICHYCIRLTEQCRRTADHVIPLSKGGLHCPENLVMACMSCNSQKGAKCPEEYHCDSSKSDCRQRQ